MGSGRNEWAMLLVATAAMIGIVVVLTLLLQPAPLPAPASQPETQAAAKTLPAPHSSKAKPAPGKLPTPQETSVVDTISAGLSVLMGLAMLGLICWAPFGIRRALITSRARYQAEGWMQAQERAKSSGAIGRLRPPF